MNTLISYVWLLIVLTLCIRIIVVSTFSMSFDMTHWSQPIYMNHFRILENMLVCSYNEHHYRRNMSLRFHSFWISRKFRRNVSSLLKEVSRSWISDCIDTTIIRLQRVNSLRGKELSSHCETTFISSSEFNPFSLIKTRLSCRKTQNKL